MAHHFVIFLCRGIDLTQWKELLQKEAEPADISNFTRHLSDNHVFPNKVFVDCTADTNVASHYFDWLKKGIHVITPNKKANSGPLDQVTILMAKFMQPSLFVKKISFSLFFMIIAYVFH
jgi:homoserine dehydrogenase